jgi:hypothetical protein
MLKRKSNTFRFGDKAHITADQVLREVDPANHSSAAEYSVHTHAAALALGESNIREIAEERRLP